MKKLKRFLSFLLAFVMVFTMAPLPAHAEAGSADPVFTFTSIMDVYDADDPCDDWIGSELPSNYVIVRNESPDQVNGYRYQVWDVSMLDPVYTVSDPSENGQGLGSGSRIREGMTITGDAPLFMTLGAYVELRDACRVTFDLGGGTTDDPVMLHGKFVTKNGILGEELLNSLQPVKDGFVFTGWQLDGVLFAPDMPVTSDILLTAVYTEESPACSHDMTEYVGNPDNVLLSATHNEICTECKKILNENVPCHMTVTGTDEEYCDWQCDRCGYAVHVPHQADGGGIPVDNYMHIYKCMYCQTSFGRKPHTYTLGEYGHGQSMCDECGYVCAHPDLYYLLGENEEYHAQSCVVCGIIGNTERHDVDSGNVLYNMPEDISKLPDNNASSDEPVHVVHCLKCDGVYLEACMLGPGMQCVKCGTVYGTEAGGSAMGDASDPDIDAMDADPYDEDVPFSFEASAVSYSGNTAEPELYVVVRVSGQQFGSVVSTGDGIIDFANLPGRQSSGFFTELGAGTAATGSYTISDRDGAVLIEWPAVTFTAGEIKIGSIPTSGDGWEYIGETDPVAGAAFPCKLTPWDPDFYYYSVAYSNSDTGAADPSVLLKRIDESTMGFTIPGTDVTEHLEIKVTAEPKGTMSVKPYAAGVVAAIYAEKKTVDQASSEDMSRIAVSTNIGSVPPAYHGRQMYPHNVRSNNNFVTTYVVLFAPTESEYVVLQNEASDGTWLDHMSRPDDYTPAPERLDGDLNNDGAINIYDASFLMNVFRGSPALVDKIRANDTETILDYLACDLDLSIHVDASDYSAWNKVPDPVEYRVTWDFNGGVDANGEPVETGHESKTTNKGSAVFSVLKLLPAPIRGDGTLVGWSRDSDASRPDEGMNVNTTSGVRNPRFTVTEPDVTYYAVYQDLRTQYVLHYDFNGGDIPGGTGHYGRDVFGKSVDSYFDFILMPLNPDGTDDAHTVSRPGYKFLGWSKDQHAGTAEYQPGETLRVTELDTTLYAMWECEHAYTDYIYNNDQTHNAVCRICHKTLSMEDCAWTELSGGKERECLKCGAKQICYKLIFSDDIFLTDYQDGSLATIEGHSASFVIPAECDMNSPSSDMAHLGWSTESGASTAMYSPSGDTVTITGTDPHLRLYPVLVAKQHYVIKYDPNGGEIDGGTGPYVSDHGFSHVGSVTVTITDKIPVRDGYRFLGWSDTKTATVAGHHAGEPFQMTDAEIVLYAVWECTHTSGYTYSWPSASEHMYACKTCGKSFGYEAHTLEPKPGGEDWQYACTKCGYEQIQYRLVFDFNGAVLDGATSYTSVYGPTSDSSHEFPFPDELSGLSREGYKLLGWGTSTTDTYGRYYNSELSHSNCETNELTPVKTIYAMWQPNTRSVTLNYDANGGVNPPDSATQSVTGRRCTFTIPDTKPTRSGYRFLGWSSYRTDSTADYQPGETCTIGLPNTTSSSHSDTLYAVWQKGYDFALYYYVDDGIGFPDTQTVSGVETDTYTFTIPDTIPTRIAYEFLGWSLQQYDNTVDYYPGETITVSTESTTLYAVWHLAAVQFYLYYDANGGSGAPDTAMVEGFGDTIDFQVSYEKPSRSGYKFMGWSLNQDGSGTLYQPGELVHIGGYSGTLYAVWQQVYSFTLNYSANNGTGAPTAQTASNVTTSTYKFTIPSTKPTRSGYQFLGWATSSTATTASYQPGGTYTASKSSTTLYAVWKLTCTHAVSYTYNGNGTHSGSCTCGKTKVTSEACSFASGSKTCSKCGGAAVMNNFTLTGTNRNKIGYSTTASAVSGKLTIPETFQDMSNNGKWYRITSIGDGAFRNCSGLTGTLTIPSSVTSIGSFAFNNCSGLTGTLTIPSSVTSIGNNAFTACKGFTGNLTIPNSVTFVGLGAFSQCSNITGTLTISKNVKTIQNSSFNQSGFSSLVILDGVTTIGQQAFSSCTNLKTVTLPTSLTAIGDHAFGYCTGLTRIPTFPSALKTLDAGAFSDCPFSGTATIPKTVTSMSGNPFPGCKNLTSLTVAAGNTSFVKVGNVIYTVDKKTLIGCLASQTGSFTIPNTVTEVAGCAFDGCQLSSITIPSSVKTINKYSFARTKVTSLKIPSSVTNISEFAFYSCRGLTSVSIPSTVTSIGMYAFYYCDRLTANIPTSVKTIGDDAFYQVPHIYYSGTAAGSPWGAKAIN